MCNVRNGIFKNKFFFWCFNFHAILLSSLWEQRYCLKKKPLRRIFKNKISFKAPTFK